MPFTLAHPAIALPLLRSRYISATGIIVGCMIPDVEYFLTMGDHCDNFHTLKAVFYSYLPLSVLFSLLFHQLIKKSLIHNLPAYFQQRLGGISHFNFLRYLRAHWFIYLYSALAGIALHFLWDGVTHGNGLFAWMPLDYINDKILFMGNSYSMLTLLQYGSSVIGIITIVIYSFRFDTRRIVSVSRVSGYYWLTTFLTVIIVMCARIYFSDQPLSSADLMISMVSSFFVGFLIGGNSDRIRLWLWSKYVDNYRKLIDSRLPGSELEHLGESVQDRMKLQAVGARQAA